MQGISILLAQTNVNPGTNSSPDTPNSPSPETSAVADFFDTGAMGLLLEGGPFMWPILLMALVGLAVIIERWRSLKMLGGDNTELKNSVLNDLAANRIEEALTRCEQAAGPVAAILANGLRKYLSSANSTMTLRLEEKSSKAWNRTALIYWRRSNDISRCSRSWPAWPHGRLSRHCSGMIVAFSDIVEIDKTGGGNIIKAAAAGIQVALLTTCFGLIVGIPAYMAFNYFSSVINTFVLDVEESAAELVEAVTLQLTLRESSEQGQPNNAST